MQRMKRAKARKELEAKNKELLRTQEQLKDLNFQYERLINKYEKNP